MTTTTQPEPIKNPDRRDDLDARDPLTGKPIERKDGAGHKVPDRRDNEPVKAPEPKR